ncbi:hypothetical protein SFUMM280S_00054 [Streptomyces fumanus]
MGAGRHRRWAPSTQQQIAEWRPAYRSAGRAIVSSGKRHLTAVGTPGAVAQVLAALIENSLMHGGGTVALRTRVAGNRRWSR